MATDVYREESKERERERKEKVVRLLVKPQMRLVWIDDII